MTKEELFHDYKLVCLMNVPSKIKIRILTALFSAHSNPWRVTGITHNALETFKQHKFKRVSKMGINRSHLVGRNESYSNLINTSYENCDEWWSYYFENDKTIFASSSENKKNNYSKIYPIDDSMGLFKSKGYAWKHGKDEEDFLRNLYRKIKKLE